MPSGRERGSSSVTLKTLGENTPITIALAIALCGGAFVAGKVSAGFEARLNNNSGQIKSNGEKLEKLEELTRALSEFAQDNKRRIDLTEKILEQLGK